jgi:chaperonin GroEL
MVPQPVILFGDRATSALARGFDQMAEMLALALGPTQGSILNDKGHGKPELLDDSAAAARRVLALPDRAADVGAMLMRNIAWRVHLRAGDGVATTAALAQAIMRGARRYLQAGGDAMAIRRGIDRARQVAVAEIARQSRPVEGEEVLTQVAQTVTGDPALSLVLGEMFDVLGPTAHITVEDYAAPYLERAYFAGGRWKAALASPYLITDPAGRRAVQDDCRVLLWAGRIETADDVIPLLTLLGASDDRTVLLVADAVEEDALRALVTNHDRGMIRVVVVNLRNSGAGRDADMADLAVLTGATVLGPAVGRSMASVTAADLGRVRRAEATAEELVISGGGGGGGGGAQARQTCIAQLRARLAALSELDVERDPLRLRLARLTGGVGVLKVGAYTEYERKLLHQRAERAIRTLALAVHEGIVPGGGIAYLAAIPAVEALTRSLDGDEQAGARIVARALEAPFRRIVANRGATTPSAAFAAWQGAGPGHIYDALAGRVAPVAETGLYDPAGVLRVALETATSGASVALSVAVMVLHRNPVQSLEP